MDHFPNENRELGAIEPSKTFGVIVFANEPRLQHRLSSLLGRTPTRASFAATPRQVMHLLEEDPTVTTLVVHGRRINPRLTKLLHAVRAARENPPVIIVLCDIEEPAASASWMLAGAHAVLSTSATDREFKEIVLALGGAPHGVGAASTWGRAAAASPRLTDFMSKGPKMKELLDVVARVADSDATLLILGETGVGKEHLARAIHAECSRRENVFVSVNCGAIPADLLESELFGHAKGAFTGAASDRRGRFEIASGGTLFLDEIGEMPQHLQVKLLSAIQQREITRLGSEHPISVDVRLMAATNRDLAQDVNAGRFRKDLYYRLNVVTLQLPALSEGKADIPEHVGTLMRQFRESLNRPEIEGITDEALSLLVAHRWPGNMRELINVIERAMLLCRGTRISRADLPQELSSESATISENCASGSSDFQSASWLDRPLREIRAEILERFERDYFSALLARYEGRVGEAAHAAGIAPRSLFAKLKTYGLRKEDFRH